MSTRKKLDERIKKKEAEVQELEMKIREAKAYIQALQEVGKFLPRDGVAAASDSESDVLRPGSMVAAARDLLLHHGRPMHLLDILTGIGKEPSNANRASLGGSLSAYVRKSEVFTRPAPNTFGLTEFPVRGHELPSTFGRRATESFMDDEDRDPRD